LIDLPASVATARGIASLFKVPENLDISAALKAQPPSSRLLSILDSQLFPLLSPMHFGPQNVLVHTSTVQHELSCKVITPESAQGAIVALWCTQEELHHRTSTAAGASGAPPLLVIGRILNIQRGKRLRTALDFSTALDANQQTTEEERGCSMVSLAVSPLPPVGCDPDHPAAGVPSFIELVRPADQVWRLASEAVSKLLPTVRNISGHKAIEGAPAASSSTTNCEVLIWQHVQAQSSPSLAPQLEAEGKNTWISIEILNIELALIAHLSQDVELLNACTAPKPWSRVAAVWSLGAKGVAVGGGVLISSATVKAIVQFLVYGWSASRLAHELVTGGVSQQQRFSKQQASMTAASFLASFPDLKTWQESTTTAWERSHQIKTLCGRVYHLPGPPATADAKLKGRLAKVAVAAMLSRSVEDVLLAAVASIDRSLVAENTHVNTNGLLVGHQGRVILTQVKEEQELEAAAAVGHSLKNKLEIGNGSTLAVALDVSICIGKVLHPTFMRSIVQ
jgi:hypothetical protein